MGCGASKPRGNDHELQPRPRPRPQTNASGTRRQQVSVPPQYRDEDGRRIQFTYAELDRNTLNSALVDMATFLDERKVHARLVTVGGAVNTLYLRSRQSTHDVDFFLQNANSSLHQTIHEAARHANRLRQGSLGARWFNNAAQVFMSADLQNEVFSAAIQQGVVVFQHQGSRGGLVVYAAPWHYAFCGKLNRLGRRSQRAYDEADAVVYMENYLRTSGRATVSVERIEGWCRRFGKNMTEQVLRQVDEAYRQKNGRSAVDWRRR